MPRKPSINTDPGKFRLALIEVVGKERYESIKLTVGAALVNWRRIDMPKSALSEAEAYKLVILLGKKYGLNVTYDYEEHQTTLQPLWGFRIRTDVYQPRWRA